MPACLVRFEGRVQGVGFRMRTTAVSKRFNVKGYVKNLDDGSVELVAQGDQDEIERFLAAIAEEMGPLIRGTTTSSVEPADYQSFGIEY